MSGEARVLDPVYGEEWEPGELWCVSMELPSPGLAHATLPIVERHRPLTIHEIMLHRLADGRIAY